MPQLLVRNLDGKLVKRLKARAKAHGRSLQGEVKEILELEAARLTPAEALEVSQKWHEYFRRSGRTFSDSAELIRKAREERDL